MQKVDVYLRVRRAAVVDGMTIRKAGRKFDLHGDTVDTLLAHSVPPGQRKKRLPRWPTLKPFTGVTDRILDGNYRAPKTIWSIPWGKCQAVLE